MIVEFDMYTDGACSKNPGEGGWGAYIKCLHRKLSGDNEMELGGYELKSTNNRMELSSIIHGLKFLKKSSRVIVFTDSMYVYNAVINWLHDWENNNWRNVKNIQVKNDDLWKMFSIVVNKHLVSWRWIKSHNNNYGNDKADFIARRSILDRRKFWCV
jgi:ribonuclease HI